MNKRGQFQISFSMIFSILLIIAIVAIAFFVGSKFFTTSKCAQIGLYYDDLKDHVNRAWQSEIHRDFFPDPGIPSQGTLPSGIEQVCFGSLSSTVPSRFRQQHTELQRSFVNLERNAFLYPPLEACETTFTSINLDHINIPSFFCVPVEDNRIKIKTEKTQFESLVTITAP